MTGENPMPAAARSTERWFLGPSSAACTTSTSVPPDPDSTFAARQPVEFGAGVKDAVKARDQLTFVFHSMKDSFPLLGPKDSVRGRPMQSAWSDLEEAWFW